MSVDLFYDIPNGNSGNAFSVSLSSRWRPRRGTAGRDGSGDAQTTLQQWRQRRALLRLLLLRRVLRLQGGQRSAIRSRATVSACSAGTSPMVARAGAGRARVLQLRSHDECSCVSVVDSLMAVQCAQ